MAQNYLRITLNPKYYKVKIGRKCRSDPIRAKKTQNDPKDGKIKERIGKTSCLSICNMHIPLINICGHGCLGGKTSHKKTTEKSLIKPHKIWQLAFFWLLLKDVGFINFFLSSIFMIQMNKEVMSSANRSTQNTFFDLDLCLE